MAFPSNQTFDVAIIGTGMGGATLGYALAKNGVKVLFLEKGEANVQDSLGPTEEFTSPADLMRHGRWPHPVNGTVDGTPTTAHGLLGCGPGGTSRIYGGALERFETSDFEPYTAQTGSRSGWPFSYEHFEPFYQQAERLYKVTGTPDPLRPSQECDLINPPPLLARDVHYSDAFQRAGLHPYRLHTAFGYAENCKECVGAVCSKPCRHDARSICLNPALATGNATLVTGCEVQRIEAGTTGVHHLVCRIDGKEQTIKSNIYVLAAGAFASPALLLASANQHWPSGLANANGMVGRNLMFHASDFVALRMPPSATLDAPSKTLAFRDYYRHNGVPLGSIQSTGLTADSATLAFGLKTMLRRMTTINIPKVADKVLSLGARAASLYLRPRMIFATILEDLPYRENRVVLDKADPNGFRFEYVVHPELRDRIRQFRAVYRKSLAELQPIILSPEISLNFGHGCGTCCIGADPQTSVLDATNKARGIDNLYVVDASFFPTSGGTNPSLTIAANALRVAVAITARLKATASLGATSL